MRQQRHLLVLIDRLRAPLEPLFSRHVSVWFRVWAGTQLVALVTATLIAVGRAGSWHKLFADSNGVRLLLVIGLLTAWHVAGIAAHRWMSLQAWRSILFIAGCWMLIFWISVLHHEYTLLVLGALLQECVFLPFQWVAGTLVLVTALVVVNVARSSTTDKLLNVVPLLVFGVIVGTVVLYIHRSNRDAAVQEDLLRRLDAAQYDLAARSREAGVLEERQRLSRDLHDTLAQGFTSVIAQLSAAELALGGPSHRTDTQPAQHDDRAALAAPYLARAQAVSRLSLAEIRQLVLALRPSALADGPLPAALDRVVNEWSQLHGIPATFDSHDVPDLVQDAEVTLLRSVQEGLGNVARHASALSVAVRLSCVDDLALLEIDDDGIGMLETVADTTEGVGLRGMRERAAALGGRVILESNGAGTSLTVALPLATITANSRQNLV